MSLKNKKVVITGADGFIGSHLTEALVEQGCRVKAFCYYNSFNSWGWLDSFEKRIINELEIFTGDVRDPNGVRTALKNADIVFHLAALIAIPYSYHSPDSYIDTNIKGTLNVLNAARDLGTQRILVTSTSEVYGTAQYVPIDEKHPRQPQSPYSASKIGADCIAESFFRSFNLPVTIVRPFNTYGPRQSARAVIPSIITQLLEKKKSIQLGDTNPTRDLLYVNDTVDAFIKIAECDKLLGEDCNIATQTEISIEALAKQLIAMIHPSSVIEIGEERKRPEKSEVFRLLGSAEKLKKLTGWQPAHSLQQGLEKTIAWYSNPGNRSSFKTDIYNI